MSDRFARVLTGLAVLTVAGVAAYVSFTHIESIAMTHGYTAGTARMLPVSVDGLIVVSSMALATGARAGLPRAGLVLGIVATITANIAYGVHFGPVGAVVNSWPAVSFIISSEILVSMVRRARTTPAHDDTAEAVAAMPVHTVDTPVVGVPTASIARPRTVPRARPRTSVSKAKSPEHVFATEIEAGQLPSLRQVKATLHVGTPKAREVLADLAETMRESQPIAA